MFLLFPEFVSVRDKSGVVTQTQNERQTTHKNTSFLDTWGEVIREFHSQDLHYILFKIWNTFGNNYWHLSSRSSVSCQLELACGVTLCLLDWLTLIIKPHWASESHINLGENWLTTSQGTGWPQSYWYLNNLCIFIATTEHCGQKSGQTNNCFDFHVIS